MNDQNCNSSIERLASFSQLSPSERKDNMLFNYLTLAVLGYFLEVRDNICKIVCSYCHYWFDLKTYDYEDHKAFSNGTCPVALKGGPMLESTNRLLDDDNSIDQALFDTGETTDNEELDTNVVMEDSKSADFASESTSFANDQNTVFESFGDFAYGQALDTKSIQIQLLKDFSEENVVFSNFERRVLSFKEYNFPNSLKSVFAMMGFYSQSQDFLKCYYCKSRFKYDSPRNMIRHHYLFSKNCWLLQAWFKPDNESLLTELTKLLHTNLPSYNPRWAYGDCFAFQCALSGFEFISSMSSIHCKDCNCSLKMASMEHLSKDNFAPKEYLLVHHLNHSDDCKAIEFFRRSCKNSNEALDRLKTLGIRSWLTELVSFQDESQLTETNIPMGLPENYDMNQTASEGYSTQIPKHTSFNLETSFLGEYINPLTEKERTLTISKNWAQNNICSVCLSKPIECIFVGCGHVSTCDICALQCTFCPICRARITGILSL